MRLGKINFTGQDGIGFCISQLFPRSKNIVRQFFSGAIFISLWKEIACQRCCQSLPALAQRRIISGDPAVEGLGHLAHLLAHRNIAYPHFTQGAIHVGEKFIDQALAEQAVLALQPIKYQKHVKGKHIEAPIHIVGHTPAGIGRRMPRGSHNCLINTPFSRCGLAEKTFEDHRLAATRPLVQKTIEKAVGNRLPVMSSASGTRAPMWLVAAFCATLLAGCSPSIEHRGYVAKPGAFGQINNGMAKTEVEGILGSPSTTASVNFQGDSYYYITSITKGRAFLRPKETNREVIAVRFDQNDQVQSFAQYGLEDGRIIDVNTRKTPVVGEDLGILRNIFRGLLNSKAGPSVGPS